MKFRRLAAAAIVAICVGGPIIEMFDQWDHTLEDGNDTEADAAVVALCIGVAFAIGSAVVVARIRALSSTSRVRTAPARSIWLVVTSFAAPIPTSSPPAQLRV